MEKFFSPKDKRKFVKWLLEETIKNKWVAVFEHKDEEGYNILRKEATIVPLPKSSRHNYLVNYKLTAVINLRISEKFINKILQNTSVLSVHNKTEMIFLIADDFHPDCFSCSLAFYDNYCKTLQEQDLVQ